MAHSRTHHADPELLAEIEDAPLSRDYYGDMVLALQSTFLYDDCAFCLLPRADWKQAMQENDKRILAASYSGLSYLIRSLAPRLCLSDRTDLRLSGVSVRRSRRREPRAPAPRTCKAHGTPSSREGERRRVRRGR